MASVTSALWPLYCLPLVGVASARDACREKSLLQKSGASLHMCFMGDPGGFLGEGLRPPSSGFGKETLCKGPEQEIAWCFKKAGGQEAGLGWDEAWGR